MADVRPFRAYRPKAGLEAQVAALPYDVYNRAEAKEAVKDKPLSFLRIDRAETAFPDDVDTYDERVYEKAAALYEERKKDGTFVQDDTPCYYLYELTMNGRTQTGIVAACAAEDYRSGVIKKHENTRADKEQDRIRHVDALNAQTGPIFLAYRKNHVLADILRRYKEMPPACDFVSEDGIRHRVWVVTDKITIEEIRRRFAGTDKIYIADGHHRCASAVKVCEMRKKSRAAAENASPNGAQFFESDYFLAVLFADDELRIMDYNRVVKDLHGLSAEEFLAQVRAQGFHIERAHAAGRGTPEGYAPKAKHEFGMYLDGVWYRLLYEGALSDDPVEALDVSVLQDKLLSPILGIGDPRTDKRIDFVGGIRGLGELVRRCETDMRVAFSLYPTSMEELFAVADAGRLMPPKSTWFEPKLRSGLFIHDLG